MDKIMELLRILIRGKLIIEGDGRTFAKAPVWLAVIAAIASIRLAIITVVLLIGFGMKARIVNA